MNFYLHELKIAWMKLFSYLFSSMYICIGYISLREIYISKSLVFSTCSCPTPNCTTFASVCLLKEYLFSLIQSHKFSQWTVCCNIQDFKGILILVVIMLQLQFSTRLRCNKKWGTAIFSLYAFCVLSSDLTVRDEMLLASKFERQTTWNIKNCRHSKTQKNVQLQLVPC